MKKVTLPPGSPNPLTEDSTSHILTSISLSEIWDQLDEIRLDREEIQSQMRTTVAHIHAKNGMLKKIENNSLIRLFSGTKKVKKLKDEIESLTNRHQELGQNYDKLKADLNFNLEDIMQDWYCQVIESFAKLAQCEKIWDVVSSKSSNEASVSHNAKMIMDRIPVHLSFGKIEYILSTIDPMYFENANGANLYIYPVFLLLKNRNQEVILVDLRDIEVSYKEQSFIESPAMVPSDTEIVKYIWDKANRDGSPDLRFKENRRRPLVKYGSIRITSKSGLDETYQASNKLAATNFTYALSNYLRALRGETSIETPDQNHIKIPVLKSSTNDIKSKNCMNTKTISPAHFEILSKVKMDLNQLFFDLSTELITDDSLSEFSTARDIKLEQVIKRCLLVDIFSTLSILQPNIDIGAIKQSGVTLIVSGLLDEIDELALIDHETFLAKHDTGEISKIAEKSLHLGKSATGFEDYLISVEADKELGARQIFS